ncbi:MAG: hypothetical protein HFH02_10210 [Dorea sp.]|nr:hypothetical protein [Dorea sp.]
MKKRNMIFWIVLVFAILFVFSPLFLRISFVEHFLLWFLKPLKDSDYKSSYIETVGAIIGTILAITGTLLLQGMIDKKEKLEKEEQKQKEIQYKIVIIYYDLKLALLDIAKIYNLLVLSAFLVDEKNKVDEFYDSASKIEIYIDENWIRNVASLYEEFDEDVLEKIFLIYGDICSIRSGLKSNNKSDYQISRLVSLISQFFNGVYEGEPELRKKYIDILDFLKTKGNIKED